MVDDRLRRRKGLEDAEASPSSNGSLGDGTPQPSGLPLHPAAVAFVPCTLCCSLHWAG